MRAIDTTVTVTDQNTGDVTTCENGELAEVVRPWFEGAPTEVLQVIDDLDAKIHAGQQVWDELQFLALSVDYSA